MNLHLALSDFLRSFVFGMKWNCDELWWIVRCPKIGNAMATRREKTYLLGALEHVLFSIMYGIILPIDFHIFFQDG